MSEGRNKYLSFLSANATSIVIVVLSIIAVIVVVRMLKRFGLWGKAGEPTGIINDEAYEVAQEVQQGGWVQFIEDLDIDQDNLTRDRNTYRNIAQSQYNILNSWWTSNAALIAGVQDLNEDELKTVLMDFGLRPSTTLWGRAAVRERMSLIEWYEYELSGSALETMKEIWEPTNIWH